MATLELLAWDKLTDRAIEPERKPVDGEWARFPSGVRKTWWELQPTKEVITLTVTLGKTLLDIGETTNYRVDADYPITTDTIPLSITDRNGSHVGNLSIKFTDGHANGTIGFASSGDYTVTEKDINFHNKAIPAYLRLATQPVIRVKTSKLLG